jgi:sortase A
MDVPRNIWNTAWYKLGYKPGERGNAVIDGHLDGQYSAAVFWNLSKLVPGNRIYVADDKGVEKVFEVYDVATYAYDQAPLDRIFGPSNDAQLNLITCNGSFDQKSANYDKRFVAYARLVNP